eukprot:GHVS01058082.1.p1 GENE.GHVS01058082.1~~GHVS01058082.1.p1  ORF type:complete len:456 (+),score=70.56 GHVS01058082.1:69-1436(+)
MCSTRRVELYYYTSWQPCFIRYKRTGEPNWQQEQMQDCTEFGRSGWHRFCVDTNQSLECVFCSADKSSWDNPPPNYGNQNYILDISNLPANYEPPPLPTTTRTSTTHNTTAPLATTSSSSRVVFTIVGGEVELVCGGKPVLVVTDLDGTLLGHDEHLNSFNKIWLQKHVWRGSKLVYNTGRNLKDFLLAAQQHQLHKPDYAIVGVGTEIYSFPAAASSMGCGGIENSHLRLISRSKIDILNPDDQDSGLCGPNWCENRFDAVFEDEWLRRMQKCFHRPSVEAIINEEFPSMSINGNIYHDPWRMSLTAQTQELFHPDTKTIERLRLKFTGCKLVVSGAGEWRYVDILPEQAGKLPPVKYVMEQLQFHPSQTLVCGDSGNDIDMFAHPEVLGVCVGNAHTDLVNFLRQDEESTELESALLMQLHQSRDLKPTPNVLFASDHCAGGIVQGLTHFGFD